MDLSIAVLIATSAFLAGLYLGRQGRGSQPETPPAPIDPEALELARRALPVEGKIGAIKAYREATRVGLREAKHAVDTLDRE